MTIPPLTYTQAVLAFSSEKAKGNATLAGKYIQLLSQITGYYNTVSNFVAWLILTARKKYSFVEEAAQSSSETSQSHTKLKSASETSPGHKKTCPIQESPVTLFDTPTSWNDVRSEPQKVSKFLLLNLFSEFWEWDVFLWIGQKIKN